MYRAETSDRLKYHLSALDSPNLGMRPIPQLRSSPPRHIRSGQVLPVHFRPPNGRSIAACDWRRVAEEGPSAFPPWQGASPRSCIHWPRSGARTRGGSISSRIQTGTTPATKRRYSLRYDVGCWSFHGVWCQYRFNSDRRDIVRGAAGRLAFKAPATIEAADCCGSSVVERSLGKGDVESRTSSIASVATCGRGCNGSTLRKTVPVVTLAS